MTEVRPFVITHLTFHTIIIILPENSTVLHGLDTHIGFIIKLQELLHFIFYYILGKLSQEHTAVLQVNEVFAFKEGIAFFTGRAV